MKKGVNQGLLGPLALWLTICHCAYEFFNPDLLTAVQLNNKRLMGNSEDNTASALIASTVCGRHFLPILFVISIAPAS